MSTPITGCPIGGRYRTDTYQDKAAYENLIVARAAMLRYFPFWGIMAMSYVLVEDTSGITKTLCTDGRHIFYNPEFVNAMVEYRDSLFAMSHEVMHCLYNHVGKISRRGDRDSDLWGFAVDYVVNGELYESFGHLMSVIQVYYDAKYKNWSAEQVYDDLLQNPDQLPKTCQQVDQHLYIDIVPDGQEDDDEGQGNQEGKGKGSKDDQSDDGMPRVRMTESEFKKLCDETRKNAIHAARVHQEQSTKDMMQSAGTLPAGIQRLIDDLLVPRIDWRSALKRFVTTRTSRRYTYQRPNKRFIGSGMTLPGFRDRVDELDIVVAVDTSGSISQDQLTKFISEMSGIIKSFRRYNILTFCFDGDVVEESVTTITRGNGDKMKDLMPFVRNLGGGGGTMFEAVFEYLKKERKKPRMILLLTDGMPCGTWGDPHYCPTMFLVAGNESRPKAPFGLTVYYEDSDARTR